MFIVADLVSLNRAVWRSTAERAYHYFIFACKQVYKMTMHELMMHNRLRMAVSLYIKVSKGAKIRNRYNQVYQMYIKYMHSHT